MQKHYISVLLCILMYHTSIAMPSDSVRQKRQFTITPRFNTLNMAPVSGTIANRNVNADVTLTYGVKNLLMTIQNGADLEDVHSEMNYFLANARYKVRLSKKMSMSPFLAFYSEHAHKLFDTGADANGGMLLTFNDKRLMIEAFALIVRLTHERKAKEAINRLEVKWKFRSFAVSGFVYHNARYFDEDERVCLGFRLILPEFVISESLSLRTDVTGSFKIYDHPKSSALNGVFLSLLMPVKF
jgi:hypothetical protein